MISVVQSYCKPSVTDNISIDALIEMIRTGQPNFELISAARADLSRKNDYKDRAFCAMPHGSFSYGNTAGFLETSGLIYLDIDSNADGSLIPDPAFQRDKIAGIPWVRAAWLSWSGRGIGFLARVDGITKHNFRHVYNEVVRRFREFDFTNHLRLDPSVSNIDRKLAVSYDPEIKSNPDASIIRAPSAPLPKNQVSTGTVSGLSFEQMAEQAAGEFTSQKIHYETPEDFSDGQDVHFYPYGKEKIKLFIRGPIFEGGRTIKLRMLAKQLAILNPSMDLGTLTAQIQSINKRWCRPIVEYKKVACICEWVIERRTAGQLWTGTEMKKVWIDRTVHKTRHEAQSISAKTIGAHRRKKRIEMLKDNLKELREELGRKPTKRELAVRSEVSLDTVKKYLKDIGWNEEGKAGPPG